MKRSDVPPDAADRIKALRQRLQLTQAELAERIGFLSGRHVVEAWERGQRPPSPAAWERLTRLERGTLPMPRAPRFANDLDAPKSTTNGEE